MGISRMFLRMGIRKFANAYVKHFKDASKLNNLKAKLQEKEEKLKEKNPDHKIMTWDDYEKKREGLEFAMHMAHVNTVGIGRKIGTFLFGNMVRYAPMPEKRMEYFKKQCALYDSCKREIAELDYYVGVGKKPVVEGEEKKVRKPTSTQLNKKMNELAEQVEALKKQNQPVVTAQQTANVVPIKPKMHEKTAVKKSIPKASTKAKEKQVEAQQQVSYKDFQYQLPLSMQAEAEKKL